MENPCREILPDRGVTGADEIALQTLWSFGLNVFEDDRFERKHLSTWRRALTVKSGFQSNIAFPQPRRFGSTHVYNIHLEAIHIRRTGF